MVKTARLKAPWPAFGGKSRVADFVWSRLGSSANYIEPFCHSAAVLLGRPDAPRIETVNECNGGMTNAWRATGALPEAVADVCEWINDVDEYVVNAWRAIQGEPEQLAGECNRPVNELDMHAAHRWLVLGRLSAEFREWLRRDPEYFDVRRAGLWISGICAWIGGGWCSVTPCDGVPHRQKKRPDRRAHGVNAGPAEERRKPNLGGFEDQHGRGVHASGGKKLPRLTGARRGDDYYGGLGVHTDRVPTLVDSERKPHLSGGEGQTGNGVNAGRPHLGDAYSLGRGVNGNDSAGTCEERRLWLLDWFQRLRDRLRTVRVCCGDWLRVCDSESVTTRLGVTGIFFDPPYPRTMKDGTHSRNGAIYASDFAGKTPEMIRDELFDYCRERGANRKLRIVVAGYAGDGYERLVKKGWEEVAWTAQGGYGNRSEVGKANAKRERLWCSPHCVRERDLFGEDE